MSYTYSTILVLLLKIFNCNAQSLTGTWLGTYYRDNPANKRIFYYRFYLQQQQDSLFGICEALDAQTDIKGINSAEANVVARYKVYNYEANTVTDKEPFLLYTGTSIENTTLSATASLPPEFFKFSIQKENEKEIFPPPIFYSPLPVNDGPTGTLRIKKISDEILFFGGFEGWNFFSTRNIQEKGAQKNFLSFLKRKKRNASDAVSKPDAKAPFQTEEKRKEKIQAVLEVDSGLATISLYDNGVVDGDTVSMFLNEVAIISRQRLAAQPLQIKIKLEEKKENRLVLFAHNLGAIPPNTALAIVAVGGVRYSLTLSSDKETSALIILKVKKR